MTVMVKRHPIMGFFAGFFLGWGLAFILFVFGVLPMTVQWLGILSVCGMILGVVLAYAIPARKAKTS